MVDPRLSEIYHTRDNLRAIISCLKDDEFCKRAGLEKDAQFLESLWEKIRGIWGGGRQTQDQEQLGGLLRMLLQSYQTRHNVLTPVAPYLSAANRATASLTAPVETVQLLPGVTGIPIDPNLLQIMQQNAASGQV